MAANLDEAKNNYREALKANDFEKLKKASSDLINAYDIALKISNKYKDFWKSQYKSQVDIVNKFLGNEKEIMNASMYRDFDYKINNAKSFSQLSKVINDLDAMHGFNFQKAELYKMVSKKVSKLSEKK